MSFAKQIKRLNILVTKIQSRPGINKSSLINSVIDQMDESYSSRSFERDLKRLREELFYLIEYDPVTGGYHLDSLGGNESEQFMNKSMKVFDSHNILTELDSNKEMTHLSLEQSDLLNPLIQKVVKALKRNKKVVMRYQKLRNLSDKEYQLSPLLLKEYDYKWYLMCDDGGVIKSFAISRIKDLEILADQSADLSLKEECIEKLDLALGVSHLNREPELIRIVTTKTQSKYLIENPIHSSQEVLEENDEVVIFQLFLIVNNELVMKLLSYGGTVRVLSPQSLYEKVVAMVSVMKNNINSSQIDINNARQLFE